MNPIESLYRSGAGALAEYMIRSAPAGRVPTGDIVRAIRAQYRPASGSGVAYEDARNVVRRAARAVNAGDYLDNNRSRAIPASRLPHDPKLAFSPAKNYSYKVVIELTDPETSESRRRLVRIESSVALTGDQAVAQARESMIADRGYYGPGDDPISPSWVETYSAIVGAGRR
jgi:hypothetical protein